MHNSKLFNFIIILNNFIHSSNFTEHVLNHSDFNVIVYSGPDVYMYIYRHSSF